MRRITAVATGGNNYTIGGDSGVTTVSVLLKSLETIKNDFTVYILESSSATSDKYTTVTEIDSDSSTITKTYDLNAELESCTINVANPDMLRPVYELNTGEVKYIKIVVSSGVRKYIDQRDTTALSRTNITKEDLDLEFLRRDLGQLYILDKEEFFKMLDDDGGTTYEYSNVFRINVPSPLRSLEATDWTETSSGVFQTEFDMIPETEFNWSTGPFVGFEMVHNTGLSLKFDTVRSTTHSTINRVNVEFSRLVYGGNTPGSLTLIEDDVITAASVFPQREWSFNMTNVDIDRPPSLNASDAVVEYSYIRIALRVKVKSALSAATMGGAPSFLPISTFGTGDPVYWLGDQSITVKGVNPYVANPYYRRIGVEVELGGIAEEALRARSLTAEGFPAVPKAYEMVSVSKQFSNNVEYKSQQEFLNDFDVSSQLVGSTFDESGWLFTGAFELSSFNSLFAVVGAGGNHFNVPNIATDSPLFSSPHYTQNVSEVLQFIYPCWGVPSRYLQVAATDHVVGTFGNNAAGESITGNYSVASAAGPICALYRELFGCRTLTTPWELTLLINGALPSEYFTNAHNETLRIGGVDVQNGTKLFFKVEALEDSRSDISFRDRYLNLTRRYPIYPTCGGYTYDQIRAEVRAPDTTNGIMGTYLGAGSQLLPSIQFDHASMEPTGNQLLHVGENRISELIAVDPNGVIKHFRYNPESDDGVSMASGYEEVFNHTARNSAFTRAGVYVRKNEQWQNFSTPNDDPLNLTTPEDENLDAITRHRAAVEIKNLADNLVVGGGDGSASVNDSDLGDDPDSESTSQAPSRRAVVEKVEGIEEGLEALPSYALTQDQIDGFVTGVETSGDTITVTKNDGSLESHDVDGGLKINEVDTALPESANEMAFYVLDLELLRNSSQDITPIFDSSFVNYDIRDVCLVSRAGVQYFYILYTSSSSSRLYCYTINGRTLTRFTGGDVLSNYEISAIVAEPSTDSIISISALSNIGWSIHPAGSNIPTTNHPLFHRVQQAIGGAFHEDGVIFCRPDFGSDTLVAVSTSTGHNITNHKYNSLVGSSNFPNTEGLSSDGDILYIASILSDGPVRYQAWSVADVERIDNQSIFNVGHVPTEHFIRYIPEWSEVLLGSEYSNSPSLIGLIKSFDIEKPGPRKAQIGVLASQFKSIAGGSPADELTQNQVNSLVGEVSVSANEVDFTHLDGSVTRYSPSGGGGSAVVEREGVSSFNGYADLGEGVAPVWGSVTPGSAYSIDLEPSRNELKIEKIFTRFQAAGAQTYTVYLARRSVSGSTSPIEAIIDQKTITTDTSYAANSLTFIDVSDFNFVIGTKSGTKFYSIIFERQNFGGQFQQPSIPITVDDNGVLSHSTAEFRYEVNDLKILPRVSTFNSVAIGQSFSAEANNTVVPFSLNYKKRDTFSNVISYGPLDRFVQSYNTTNSTSISVTQAAGIAIESKTVKRVGEITIPVNPAANSAYTMSLARVGTSFEVIENEVASLENAITVGTKNYAKATFSSILQKGESYAIFIYDTNNTNVNVYREASISYATDNELNKFILKSTELELKQGYYVGADKSSINGTPIPALTAGYIQCRIGYLYPIPDVGKQEGSIFPDYPINNVVFNLLTNTTYEGVEYAEGHYRRLDDRWLRVGDGGGSGSSSIVETEDITVLLNGKINDTSTSYRNRYGSSTVFNSKGSWKAFDQIRINITNTARDRIFTTEVEVNPMLSVQSPVNPSTNFIWQVRKTFHHNTSELGNFFGMYLRSDGKFSIRPAEFVRDVESNIISIIGVKKRQAKYSRVVLETPVDTTANMLYLSAHRAAISRGSSLAGAEVQTGQLPEGSPTWLWALEINQSDDTFKIWVDDPFHRFKSIRIGGGRYEITSAPTPGPGSNPGYWSYTFDISSQHLPLVLNPGPTPAKFNIELINGVWLWNEGGNATDQGYAY